MLFNPIRAWVPGCGSRRSAGGCPTLRPRRCTSSSRSWPGTPPPWPARAVQGSTGSTTFQAGSSCRCRRGTAAGRPSRGAHQNAMHDPGRGSRRNRSSACCAGSRCDQPAVAARVAGMWLVAAVEGQPVQGLAADGLRGQRHVGEASARGENPPGSPASPAARSSRVPRGPRRRPSRRVGLAGRQEQPHAEQHESSSWNTWRATAMVGRATGSSSVCSGWRRYSRARTKRRRHIGRAGQPGRAAGHRARVQASGDDNAAFGQLHRDLGPPRPGPLCRVQNGFGVRGQGWVPISWAW